MTETNPAPTRPAFDAVETAAILAGLRMLQTSLIAGDTPLEFEEIWTDGFTIEPLSIEGIDELCEAING